MAKASPYETGILTDSIFLILVATLEPIHGYRLMQKIQEITQGTIEVGPATMYTTLKKLKEAGWIEETHTDDSKILYRISPAGQQVAADNYQSRKKMVEIVERILPQEGRK